MTTIVIYTAAKTDTITKTLGAALKGMKPNTPPHKFISYNENEAAPTPQAGEVVLVCGDKPLSRLREMGVVAKKATINQTREKPIPCNGGFYMTTYDPNIISNQPELNQVIGWDVRLATRLLKTGTTKPVVGKYEFVNTFEPQIEYIKKRYKETGKPVQVALDTEGMTFFPWYEQNDLISLQITVKPGEAQVLYLGPQYKPPIELDPDRDLFSQVEWMLTSSMVKLVIGNGKFDLVWIAEKWGIECTNFVFDPILAGNLLDENRSNSLNMLCKLKTDMGGYDDDFNDKYDKGHMELVKPDNEFLTYAGGDTDGLYQAADVIRDELCEDAALTKFYIKIMHPAARAFEKIERRGVCIDVEKMQALSADLHAVMKKSQDAALALLPQKMKIKYRDKIDDQLAKGKSPFTSSLLKEYFFGPTGLNLKPKMVTEKTKEPSTAKAHLKMFGDNPDAKAMVEQLTEYDVAAKTDSTFVGHVPNGNDPGIGYLKHLRPDGKFHPSYMLFHGGMYDDEDDEAGTVTGRLSAKDPAIQLIPKKTKWAKRIREAFIAPPGKTVCCADYIQGELKVVACVGNEEAMIHAYLKGLDLHAVTGAKLGGMSYEAFNKLKDLENEPWLDAPFDANTKTLAGKFKYLRDRAKPANFGLLYGMSAEGLIAYAWASYNLKLTLEEATVIREMFFALYPGLLTYHDKQRKLVKHWEMVRSPLGRIRHLPTIRAWDREVKAKAERQAINSPIQSTLSDMMLWAIARIEAALPGQIEIVAMIHDAFVAYVEQGKELEVMQKACDIMADLPFHELDWTPQLRFTAEAEAGPDLAHLHHLPIAA